MSGLTIILLVGQSSHLNSRLIAITSFVRSQSWALTPRIDIYLTPLTRPNRLREISAFQFPPEELIISKFFFWLRNETSKRPLLSSKCYNRQSIPVVEQFERHVLIPIIIISRTFCFVVEQTTRSLFNTHTNKTWRFN